MLEGFALYDNSSKQRYPNMSKLECLPDEVLCQCLKFCDNKNVRIVNRRFYHIRNEWFKHKVLTIFPLSHPVWETILTPLVQYIKELDPIRGKARLLLLYLLHSSQNFDAGHVYPMESMQYIADSWEIIYSILQRPLPVYNFDNSMDSRYQIQRRDRHFQILSNNNIILPNFNQFETNSIGQNNKKLPLNVWIYIEDVHYSRYINKIITEFSSYGTQNEVEVFFFGTYLHEWIKEPGVYCIKLGDIPYRFMNTRNTTDSYSPFAISSYIGNEVNWNFSNKLRILGYSFDVFSPTHQWIFFKLPLIGENCVLNKWGSIISTLIANYYIEKQQQKQQQSDSRAKMSSIPRPSQLSNGTDQIDYNITFPLNFFYTTPMDNCQYPTTILKDLRLPRLINM